MLSQAEEFTIPRFADPPSRRLIRRSASSMTPLAQRTSTSAMSGLRP